MKHLMQLINQNQFTIMDVVHWLEDLLLPDWIVGFTTQEIQVSKLPTYPMTVVALIAQCLTVSAPEWLGMKTLGNPPANSFIANKAVSTCKQVLFFV